MLPGDLAFVDAASTKKDSHEHSDTSKDDFDIARIRVPTFLEVDPRPTFIVDSRSHAQDLKSVYCNGAIKAHPQLLEVLPLNYAPEGVHQATGVASIAFVQWAKHLVVKPETTSSTISFLGIVWTGFVVADYWVVISCNLSAGEFLSSTLPRRNRDLNVVATEEKKTPLPATKPRITHFPRELGALKPEKQVDEAVPSFINVGTPDWTVVSPVGELSPHLKFARSIDWASTPLGDMKTWSPEFRQICNHLMANPHPAAVFYGEDLTVLYNQAYVVHAAGQKHPAMFGTGFSGFYSELWGMVKPIFDSCTVEAKSVAVESQMLPIERNGFLEETFYTWSLTPLFGGTDRVMGFYNAPFETTRAVRSARALATLLRLAEEMQQVTRIDSFWPSIMTALLDNAFDFPFALLYSMEKELESVDGVSSSLNTSVGSTRSRYCLLKGTLGVPNNHPVAPSRLDLEKETGGFVRLFTAAVHKQEPILVSATDNVFDQSLLGGINWRGFKEPCREFVVCPIRPSAEEEVMGFLCIGLNPRRTYDVDYESFIDLLTRQLATSLTAVTLLEVEIQRGFKLSKELNVQRSRLQRMTEVSPVGMFQIDASGTLLEANERWHEITTHRLDAYHPLSWAEPFVAGDALDQAWKKLSVDHLAWSGELQLRQTRYDTTRKENLDVWVLASARPEFVDGEYRGILGSITDISTLKWAENIQIKQLEESEKTRRSQNNFIDITSHELRNPLSAMIQCADGITLALRELTHTLPPGPQLQSIQESIASAETIQLCAMYQKNIIDDILTISKLDSDLVVISPVVVQPVLLVQQAVQMFYHETQKVHDIQLKFNIGKTYHEMGVSKVMLDSSRLLQILINLITNAIKFTKTSAIREIDITIDAYHNPPTQESVTFNYFPTKGDKSASDVTAGADWGKGEVLYLRFTVNDSGCGLTREEKNRLFHRFQQASPKTHVQYGGSGLGLFISRQLAELQGGEIGVASEAGVGSKFAFYVRCRRVEMESGSEDIPSQSHLSTIPIMDPSNKIDVEITPPRTLLDTDHIVLETKSQKLAPGPQSWHVLIVEDNLVNQRVLALQLRKLGCTVHVANHGQEALDHIKQSKAYRGMEENGHDLSIVLMDLEMPVMDGLTAIRAIRELEIEGKLLLHLPVIAVSANARAEQIATARNSGMDSVVSKPFRIKELVPKIAELLSIL